MLDSTHHMLILPPDRAPHRHIIKAAVQDPGGGPLGFERRDGCTHGRQGLLDFVGLAHEVRRLATEEVVIEHAPMVGGYPNDRERAVAVAQAAVQAPDTHEM